MFCTCNSGFFGQSTNVNVLISDLFPTCSDLKSFNKARRVTGEPSMKNGIYAIDIDGPLGLSPFAVVCSGYATQIPNYRGNV